MIHSRPWSQNGSLPNLLATIQVSYPHGRSLCSTPGAGRNYPNVTAWWNGWRIERKHRKRLCCRALCDSRYILLCHVMTLLRGYQCPYRPSPFPTITPIRAPALATQTVPMLDPSVNPSLNSVGNHHVRSECRSSTIGESQDPES